jgi:hypothetical protein
VRFLRPLLGFTSLDYQRNYVRGAGYATWKEWTETAYENNIFSANPGGDGMMEHPGKDERPRTP